MNSSRIFTRVIVSIAAIAALLFISNLVGWLNFSFFAPRIEAVRAQTFEQSQTYNDGMVRDLQEFQLEWGSSSDTQKATIRAVVLQRFAHYDESRLPADLRAFYDQQIKEKQQ